MWSVIIEFVSLCEKAAHYIKEADGLLITGGAGMGVDSGLPDFRGNEGFWKAYPVLASNGVSFIEIAQPHHFNHNPRLAWGFYGHRLNLYRNTIPHDGYRMLKDLGETCPLGSFVFTSNVDGHYQKSGFDPERVLECHGSIHHLQCINDCSHDVWLTDETSFEIDEANCKATSSLPYCPVCGDVARPNILMFDDLNWNDQLEVRQRKRFDDWLSKVKNLVIIECGAGTAIPSVRQQGDFQKGKLIRINTRDANSDNADSICIKEKAIVAVSQIYESFARL